MQLPRDTVGLLEGIVTTRAIRRFTGQPVTDDELAAVLFAATRAPSGSNRQPFRFIVLRDGPKAGEAKALLATGAKRFWAAKRAEDGYDRGSGADPSSPKARMARTMAAFVDGFAGVPVVVLGALVRYREASPSEGASIYPACQNLLLGARAVGLGGVLTQWHGLVEPDLRALLAIPDDVALHATIALGHPAGHHGPVRRRPVAEMVYDDEWGRPAPWAVDPDGTRFTDAGPSRSSPPTASS